MKTHDVKLSAAMWAWAPVVSGEAGEPPYCGSRRAEELAHTPSGWTQTRCFGLVGLHQFLETEKKHDCEMTAVFDTHSTVQHLVSYWVRIS